MQKTVNFIRKNQIYIVWAIAGVLLFVLVVLAIRWRSSVSDEKDLSLEFYQPSSESISLDMGNDKSLIANSTPPTNIIGVYSLDLPDLSGKVSGFVSEQNIIGLNEETSEYMYSWVSGEYLIYLFKKQPIFSFYSQKGINMGMATVDPQKDNSKYLKQLAQSILGLDRNYGTARTYKDGDLFRIEANLVVDGVEVLPASYEDYTDFVSLDSNGLVRAIKLTTFVVDEELDEQETLGAAEIISEINNNSSEGKIYYHGPLVSSSSSLSDDPYNFEQNSLDVRDVTDCRPTEMILGYLYFENTSTLNPVYRIGCTGTYTNKDKIYTVPVVLYLSAINVNQ